MMQRSNSLLAVLTGLGLLLAGCTQSTPSQSLPPPVSQTSPEPQPQSQPKPQPVPEPTTQPVPDPQTNPKPAESPLLQRFMLANVGAKVLQSIEEDLNGDGAVELVVAYQPVDSKGAIVGLLHAGGELLQVDSINLSEAVQPLKVLNHGDTIHLVVIMGLGHNYVTSLYTFDGQRVSKFWQVEADEFASVKGNELVIQRRKYKDPGYDVETAILSWDPVKKGYVVRKG